MIALYPKVRSNKLTEFLQSLAPDTIIEMWVELCGVNKYETSGFNWEDLETMVSNNPTAVGLDIVEDDSDWLKDYAYDNLEMDDLIAKHLKGE